MFTSKVCLFQAGKVNEKTYGKAKVFVVNQDLVTSPNGANVAEMDSRILELTRQIAEDEDFLKKTESELKVINSSLSIEEIKDQLKSVSVYNVKLTVMILIQYLSIIIQAFGGE